MYLYWHQNLELCAGLAQIATKNQTSGSLKCMLSFIRTTLLWEFHHDTASIWLISKLLKMSTYLYYICCTPEEFLMITCSTFSIYLSKAAQGIKIENVKCIQARIVCIWFELNFQKSKKDFWKDQSKYTRMKFFS